MTKDAISRLTDSAGDGPCTKVTARVCFVSICRMTPACMYSARSLTADGIKFEEPNDQMFSFNSPLGACPRCEGFGKIIGIDEHLVVPNRAPSVYDGAVLCWRAKMGRT